MKAERFEKIINFILGEVEKEASEAEICELSSLFSVVISIFNFDETMLRKLYVFDDSINSEFPNIIRTHALPIIKDLAKDAPDIYDHIIFEAMYMLSDKVLQDSMYGNSYPLLRRCMELVIAEVGVIKAAWDDHDLEDGLAQAVYNDLNDDAKFHSKDWFSTASKFYESLNQFFDAFEGYIKSIATEKGSKLTDRFTPLRERSMLRNSSEDMWRKCDCSYPLTDFNRGMFKRRLAKRAESGTQAPSFFPGAAAAAAPASQANVGASAARPARGNGVNS